MDRSDMALAIERTLNADENARIVDAFVRMNPSSRGIQPADVLDMLDGVDSHLELIEPLAEAHAPGPDPISEPGLFGGAVRAQFLMTGTADWPDVANLIERVRAYLKRAPDVEVLVDGGHVVGAAAHTMAGAEALIVTEAGTGEPLDTDKAAASGHGQPDLSAAELAKAGYRLCRRCQLWQTTDADQVCGECRAAGRS